MSNLIEFLTLAANLLTGSLPSELGNITSLDEMYLNNNGFTGSIPAEFANLSHLHILDIIENRLTGTVPGEICKLPELHLFYADRIGIDGKQLECQCCRDINDFEHF
jgi:Leucine-rich repeat (LRR) protein